MTLLPISTAIRIRSHLLKVSARLYVRRLFPASWMRRELASYIAYTVRLADATGEVGYAAWFERSGALAARRLDALDRAREESAP